MKFFTDTITFFKICIDKDSYTESNKVNTNDVKLDILNKLKQNNINKYKYDEYFMKEAFRISNLSSSKKIKVGCIIVKNNQILSTGYNRCINNESTDESSSQNINEEPCEDLNNKTKWYIIHAEIDCIMNFVLFKNNNENINKCRMFCTLSPCRDCAKFILRSGIKEIIYKDEYKQTDGIKFLINNGVNVYKLK